MMVRRGKFNLKGHCVNDQVRCSLRATLCMRVDSPQFTADAHAGNLAKIYGLEGNQDGYKLG